MIYNKSDTREGSTQIEEMIIRYFMIFPNMSNNYKCLSVSILSPLPHGKGGAASIDACGCCIDCFEHWPEAVIQNLNRSLSCHLGMAKHTHCSFSRPYLVVFAVFYKLNLSYIDLLQENN